MKKFWDYIFPEYKFSDVMLIEGTFEHLGFYKPLQSFVGNDPFDLWRMRWLSSQIFNDMEKRGYFPEELKRESKKLDLLIKLRYVDFVLGALFGALVINPAYIGKTSKPIRRSVPIFSGLAFFAFGHMLYQYYGYSAKQKLYDHMPPHVRRCMESKDSRYLALLDLNDLKINDYNHDTKKFIY